LDPAWGPEKITTTTRNSKDSDPGLNSTQTNCVRRNQRDCPDRHRKKLSIITHCDPNVFLSRVHGRRNKLVREDMDSQLNWESAGGPSVCRWRRGRCRSACKRLDKTDEAEFKMCEGNLQTTEACTPPCKQSEGMNEASKHKPIDECMKGLCVRWNSRNLERELD
jgi:hypothetical protein